MKRNRNDIIAEIKTARAQAQTQVNAYENVPAKRYDLWRALATVIAYHGALASFEQATEHEIPDRAAAAVAHLERLHRSGLPVPEVNFATAEGRRDALVSVAEWMTDEGSNR